MVEIAQQLHFTQSPQTEHRVIERDDLLDSDFLAGGFVDRRAGVEVHVSMLLIAYRVTWTAKHTRQHRRHPHQ